jgi:hypothetical protein
MRKWLFLFFVLIPSLSIAGFLVGTVTDPASVGPVDTPASVGGVDSDYGADWSSIGFFWRCEGTTLDSSNDRYGLNNSGDNTASAQSSAAIDSGLYKHGTHSCDIPTPADHFVFSVSDTMFQSSEGRIGFWFRFTTWVDGKYLFLIQYDPNNRMWAYMRSGDGLGFDWTDSGTGRTAITDDDCGLTSNSTWYYLEFAWKVSTNYRQIFVNGVAHDSSSETIAAFATEADEAFLGEALGGGSTDFHFDDFIFSTDSTLDLYTNFSDKTAYGE